MGDDSTVIWHILSVVVFVSHILDNHGRDLGPSGTECPSGREKSPAVIWPTVEVDAFVSIVTIVVILVVIIHDEEVIRLTY